MADSRTCAEVEPHPFHGWQETMNGRTLYHVCPGVVAEHVCLHCGEPIEVDSQINQTGYHTIWRHVNAWRGSTWELHCNLSAQPVPVARETPGSHEPKPWSKTGKIDSAVFCEECGRVLFLTRELNEDGYLKWSHDDPETPVPDTREAAWQEYYRTQSGLFPDARLDFEAGWDAAVKAARHEEGFEEGYRAAVRATAERCAQLLDPLYIDPDGDHDWPAERCMEYNRALMNAQGAIRAEYGNGEK